ncbi:MAG: DUF4249 domain-containing protein, partial [Bacteroidota bacterium]|nr:DUF4249 domain-containing protein [Bacteroidota bacterium]
MKTTNSKYRFMVRAFVSPVDRLLRRTLVRSENNWVKTKAVCFCTFFFLVLCLSSCTKVINVQLKEAEKQLVIEGSVAYGDTSFPQVKISETKSFEDDNSFVGVSGATVTIQMNNGTTYHLFEGATGIYQ